MELGDYRVEIIPDCEFKLDGGAMFGVVPRVFWERVCPPDELNCVKLTCNCLFIGIVAAAAQLAPHFPADPEQQNAAHQYKPENLE